MSNAAITAVFERSQSKGVTRLVLLSIADRADDGGRAWCGANDIASRANIERRNVPRAIRELCDSGELFVEHRKGPNCSNVYHLSSVLMAKLPQNEAVSGRVVGVLKVSTKCSQGEAQTQGNPIEPKGGEGKGRADASHSISEVPSKWNEFTNLPSVKNLSDDRKRHLAARMAEPFFEKHWNEAIERISRSSFCLGQNKQGWKARFDWFLRPGTVTKIMEGQYDNYPASNGHTHSTPRESNIDRTAINPDDFKSYLARQYPAGLRQGWTPESASEGVVRNFLDERKAAA
jgi:hypothetical protein